MEEDEYLGGARIPGKAGALSLFKKDGEFTLRVDGAELMNSRAHESEDALAGLVCAKLTHVDAPVLLIGGLGMGYTLAAALKGVGPKGKVVVSELVPAVVEWNRGPLGPLAGHPLADPRVQVRVEDVSHSLKTGRDAFDGILLDVDNGPEAMTRGTNDWIYSEDGLAASYAALRPGGTLAVWSAAPDKGFAMRLQKIGFSVQEVRVPTGIQGMLERNVIWLAVR